MNSADRAALQAHAFSFIKSPQFIDYLRILYRPTLADPGILPLMQKAYVESMADAVIEHAYVWMANSTLTSGQEKAGAALLVCGALGNDESERYVEYVCQRLGNQDWGHTSAAARRMIEEQLGDEEFSLFRCRTLPLEFTDNYPVHLFEAMLAADNLFDPKGRPLNAIPCLVNPKGTATVFAIPMFVCATVGFF
jgi:hypothetical protein